MDGATPVRIAAGEHKAFDGGRTARLDGQDAAQLLGIQGGGMQFRVTAVQIIVPAALQG